MKKIELYLMWMIPIVNGGLVGGAIANIFPNNFLLVLLGILLFSGGNGWIIGKVTAYHRIHK